MTRICTFQEIILTSTSALVCGNNHVQWNDFSRTISYLDLSGLVQVERQHTRYLGRLGRSSGQQVQVSRNQARASCANIMQLRTILHVRKKSFSLPWSLGPFRVIHFYTVYGMVMQHPAPRINNQCLAYKERASRGCGRDTSMVIQSIQCHCNNACAPNGVFTVRMDGSNGNGRADHVVYDPEASIRRRKFDAEPLLTDCYQLQGYIIWHFGQLRASRCRKYIPVSDYSPETDSIFWSSSVNVVQVTASLEHLPVASFGPMPDRPSWFADWTISGQANPSGREMMSLPGGDQSW